MLSLLDFIYFISYTDDIQGISTGTAGGEWEVVWPLRPPLGNGPVKNLSAKSRVALTSSNPPHGFSSYLNGNTLWSFVSLSPKPYAGILLSSSNGASVCPRTDITFWYGLMTLEPTSLWRQFWLKLLRPFHSLLAVKSTPTIRLLDSNPALQHASATWYIICISRFTLHRTQDSKTTW